MKQFIWQVKRGIREKSVVWHVAPIFWSKEGGTGKSHNVKRILEPLEAFRRNVDVNELGEKFSGRLFARTLIAYLDEFAGAELAPAAQLKALLTGKPFDSRSMYSESGFYAPNRLSCIATSNIDPPHGFVDHTGARRFWSIHCSAQRMDDNPERAAALDAIDVDKVWAAISVIDDSPQYTASAAVLRFMEHERDQNLRTKTSLEEFCAECLEESEGERIPMKDFQKMYRDYCHEGKQAMVRGSYRVLAQKLRELGYTTTSTNNRYMIKNMGLVDFTRNGE
jgi:predicted P-loop ATPase